MRVVHLSQDMEAIARIFSPERALAPARDRRDLIYDPQVTDVFLAHGSEWLERLRTTECSGSTTRRSRPTWPASSAPSLRS